MGFPLVFWRDVPVKVRDKVWHIHKFGGKVHRNLCTGFGEIPVASFNEETNKLEPVVNSRGYGYAKRRDLKFRKTRRQKLEKLKKAE